MVVAIDDADAMRPAAADGTTPPATWLHVMRGRVLYETASAAARVREDAAVFGAAAITLADDIVANISEDAMWMSCGYTIIPHPYPLSVVPGIHCFILLFNPEYTGWDAVAGGDPTGMARAAGIVDDYDVAGRCVPAERRGAMATAAGTQMPFVLVFTRLADAEARV